MYYPIALDLRGRCVVVVGGGNVAERKIRGLLASQARIVVVAPEATDELRAAAVAGSLELRLRTFEKEDLDGAVLVFAATNEPAVNALVAEAARARGSLVDDTSGTAASDFSTALAHRIGPLTFAVDTGGISPSFAIRLVGELRERYGEAYGRAATTLGRARDYAKAVVPAEQRARVMTELAARDIAELAAMNASAVENEVEAVYETLQGKPSVVDEPLMQLVCATRASALAMWQTRHVMGTLARAGLVSTVMQISTKGDRVQDRALTALGTDGIFVKELEQALRDGRADYAVHSCKDLPSELPDDMRLAAIGLRADPRDAFCSERYPTFDALPQGAVVGTSSPRRRAQLQARRADLRFETIRGNVDTRLRKLREGAYDAIVLALAGLQRLGLGATYTVPLPVDVVIPAVAQGALGIEVRAADARLAARIHEVFADDASEIAVRAERAFLRTLRGGCQAPVGAYATYALGQFAMQATICAPDGSRQVRGERRASLTDAAQAEALGEALARQLLAEGGETLLEAVRGGDAALPLAGRLFLLPRTQDRPSQLAPALRGAGAEVVEVRGDDDVARALDGRTPDGLLFPSSGSVAAVAAYLAELLASGVRPFVAAMGQSSAAAARTAGLPPDVIATEASVGAFVQGVTHYALEHGEGNTA